MTHPRYETPTGTLWMGDCLELMRNIPDGSIDMVLCDLPYGTTACKWDVKIPFEPLWDEYWRICRGSVVLTAAQPFTSALVMSQIDNFRQSLVYEKTNATGHMNAKNRFLVAHEDIVMFAKRPTVFNPIKWEIPEHLRTKRKSMTFVGSNGVYGVEGKTRKHDDGSRYPISVITVSNHTNKLTGSLHPTQKPVALFEYLIRTYTDEGATVLDNCIGSGTTAIAAMQSNRRWIGIERDPGYYLAAALRIQAAL